MCIANIYTYFFFTFLNENLTLELLKLINLKANVPTTVESLFD